MTSSITAGAIATLVFVTAVEKIAGSLAEGAMSKAAEKLKKLQQIIWSKLKGKPKVEKALAGATHRTQIDIDKVAAYLEVAMDEDDEFARTIQTLADEIQQEISVNQNQAGDTQTIHDNTINNPGGPAFQGVQGDVNITY
ncbi:MAG: hypothetical protein F6K19_32080 [Cyanothece sp. SIO1E1]|nr:hypothetical protein [Cyanothece sp. SIO1E1]